MNKFKIGDKVRVKKNCECFYPSLAGKTLTVAKDQVGSAGGGNYCFEGCGTEIVLGDFLEKVEESSSLKFKLGDVVRVVGKNPNNPISLGHIGTIKSITNWRDLYIYKLNNSGVILKEDWLELADEKIYFTPKFYHAGISNGTTYFSKPNVKGGGTMKELGVIAKKLLDPKTRALVTAGYLDADLELTREGENVLTNLAFLKHKEEMVEEAKKAIRKAKKNKKCEDDEDEG